MTDLEATALCAAAMGYKGESLTTHWGGLPMFASEIGPYNPLHDDAQAMALVKRFRLNIDFRGYGPPYPSSDDQLWDVEHNDGEESTQHSEANLNRAIVYCVAAMQEDKEA